MVLTLAKQPRVDLWSENTRVMGSVVRVEGVACVQPRVDFVIFFEPRMGGRVWMGPDNASFL